MTLHTPITDNYIHHLWDGLMLIHHLNEYRNKRGEIYLFTQFDNGRELLLQKIDTYYRGSGMHFHAMREEIDKSIGGVEDIQPILTRMWQKFKPLYEEYNKTVAYLTDQEEDSRENALELIGKDFGEEVAEKVDYSIDIGEISNQFRMNDKYFADLKALLPKKDNDEIKSINDGKNRKQSNQTEKPFEDYLSYSPKGKLLEAIRELMHDKKGREVALIIRALLNKGYLEIPNRGRSSLYKAMESEFGDIGKAQGINHYLSETTTTFKPDEIKQVVVICFQNCIFDILITTCGWCYECRRKL